MESFRQHNSLRDHNRKQAFVDNLQKSLVGEFEISDNDTNLEKALDLTHGGRLVPKHIIDANGHKRLVYVLPEEITHRHEALKVGDKFKTKNGEEHELVREKGHDNKGGHLVTLKDKTGRIHDKYIHNLESVGRPQSSGVNKDDNEDDDLQSSIQRKIMDRVKAKLSSKELSDLDKVANSSYQKDEIVWGDVYNMPAEDQEKVQSIIDKLPVVDVDTDIEKTPVPSKEKPFVAVVKGKKYLVDPQGYNYPRYVVGLNEKKEDEWKPIDLFPEQTMVNKLAIDMANEYIETRDEYLKNGWKGVESRFGKKHLNPNNSLNLYAEAKGRDIDLSNKKIDIHTIVEKVNKKLGKKILKVVGGNIGFVTSIREEQEKQTKDPDIKKSIQDAFKSIGVE